jgi:hypothetical protein
MQWNRINSVQQTNPLIYRGFAGAFGSFFQTGDPNAHKLTAADVFGVPELKRTGEEWIIAETGFAEVTLRELKDRCDFLSGIGGRVPV